MEGIGTAWRFRIAKMVPFGYLETLQTASDSGLLKAI